MKDGEFMHEFTNITLIELNLTIKEDSIQTCKRSRVGVCLSLENRLKENKQHALHLKHLVESVQKQNQLFIYYLRKVQEFQNRELQKWIYNYPPNFFMVNYFMVRKVVTDRQKFKFNINFNKRNLTESRFNYHLFDENQRFSLNR